MSTALAKKKYDYKQLAHKMRNKLRNQDADMAKMTKGLTGLAFGAAAGGGMGYWMGQLEHKKEIEGLDGDKDPTKVGPVPIPLLAGGVLSAGGLLLGGFTKSKSMGWVNELAESGGAGIVSGYAYHEAFKAGKKAAAEG